jgi:hypothetical protein
VAALRLLASLKEEELFGWVLDERKAYRQVPISPAHRKFSVVTFKHYETGKPAYFIMIGHSFGLVSAVYNYNRRSALIDEILRNVFELVSFNFYDDKFGFEPSGTAGSAMACAELVHFWLGAAFDQKKLQLKQNPDVLGVTYDLKALRLLIKESRIKELTEEIEAILSSEMLEPGHAGKLKGKLMFGASQLWGKVGRAFLLAISERQYMKNFDPSKTAVLGPALTLALKSWLKLLRTGPPREINPLRPAPSDVVLFTDGYTPDQRKAEIGPSRIGMVMFARYFAVPAQAGGMVQPELMTRWLPRATQICMVELFAAVAALETFGDYLRGKTVLLFVDSEAIEAALVKGYSSRSDICELVGVFWDKVQSLKCMLYIDRVPTDANCSDGASRDKLQVGEALGWKTVPFVWPRAVVEGLGCLSGDGGGTNEL